MRYTDPDGRNIAFVVDPEQARGNGHTSLYFQDDKKKWYKFDQGAQNGPSNFLGSSYSEYLFSEFDAGVSIVQVEKLPDDVKEIKTSKKQDMLIFNSAYKSYREHNNGIKRYHLFYNNCTDAAVDVVNKSGAKIKIPNPAFTVKPNSWIKKLEKWYEKNSDQSLKLPDEVGDYL